MSRLNAYQKICSIFLLVLVVFWIALFLTGEKSGPFNYLFAFLYALMPFIGGIAAIRGYQEWGGLSTILGKAILFLGLGLFMWGFGKIAWVYYAVIPGTTTASLPDWFFAPSVLLYTLGTIYLSLTTGIRLSLKFTSSRIFAIVTPIAILVLCYYVLVALPNAGGEITDKHSLLQSILNIAYPLSDAVSLAVSAVVATLSFRYLGGLYKTEIIFILAGLIGMFAADSYFAYSTISGSAYIGGAGDLLYTLALFLLTCGLLGFNKFRRSPVAATV
jgi:hypothetical protein